MDALITDLLLVFTCVLLLLIATKPVALRWLNADVAYQLWWLVPISLLLPPKLLAMHTPDATWITFFAEQMPKHPLPLLSAENSVYGLLIWPSLWLFGFVVMVARYSYHYRQLLASFRPLTQALSPTVWPPTQTPPPQAIIVVESSLVDTPAVAGFFRRYLILPAHFMQLSCTQQRLILSHECCHLRRRDHQINFAVAAIKCLFWFHPLLHWAAKQFAAVQEISCDFTVNRTLTPSERQHYAQALIDVVCVNRSQHLLSPWKYSSLIKERIKMLQQTKTVKWHTVAGLAIALSTIWISNNIAVADASKQAEVRPTKQVAPRYPKQAAEQRQTGHVKLGFDISAAGEPINIKVVESSPQGVFDSVAIDAFKQWKFESNKSTTNQQFVLKFQL